MGDPTYATEERLWEFQTRLIENVDKCKEAFRKNDSTAAAPATYKTLNGTVPARMTLPIRNMLSGDDNEVQRNMTGSTPCVLSEEDHGEAYKFVNLPASIVQLLTPRIEVYKIYKAPEGSTEEDRAYLLHQGKHKKSAILAALAAEDITLHDDNMQGVVLQSVDFTKLGGNPAEVHTNIKFNMRLYAKNVTEFFVRTDSYPDTLDSNEDTDEAMAEWFEYLSNDGIADNARLTQTRQALGVAIDRRLPQQTLDLLSRNVARSEAVIAPHRAALQAATDVKGTAWIDIIKIDPGQALDATGIPSQPRAAATANANLAVEEGDVRIKVDIGYSFSSKSKPTDIPDEAWAHWQTVVERQKETFFLSLLKHEFSFLGMSGVELSVDFVATGNAKALQPSYDVLGAMDWEIFLEAHNFAFNGERKERKHNQEKLAQLQEDLASEEAALALIPAAMERAEADLDLWKTTRQDAGLSVNRIAQVQFGSAFTRAIDNVSGSKDRLEQSIRDLTSKIETCEEKIEEINEQEQERDIEANRTKTNIRVRLLKQLYLEDDVSLLNRDDVGTRVHRATTARLAASSSIFTPESHTGFDSNNLNNALRADAANSAERNAERDQENIFTTVSGESDVMTTGGFVFLADIFEAAYECITNQVHSASMVTYLALLNDTLETAIEEEANQEALNALTPVVGLFSALSGRLQTPSYRAAQEETERIRREISNVQDKTVEVLASMSNDDFKTKILSKFDGIITGNVMIQHPSLSNETITMPISDIPISIDLFREWFRRAALTRVQYPLRDFIPDVMKFVEDMFGKIKYRDGTLPRDIKSYDLPRFALNSVSYQNKLGFTMYSKKFKSFTSSSIASRIELSKGSNSQRTATVIEQVHVGNMSKAGVPNLIFGQATKGILKQISFEREDIPGHAEARLMTDRDSVSSNIALREKYNVSIETRGTTSFLPGSTFYLDITPIELGYTSEENSYAKRLGLGGMYRVVSVESTISFDGGGNSWTTKLKTKWESFGDGTNGDPNQLGTRALSGAECR